MVTAAMIIGHVGDVPRFKSPGTLRELQRAPLRSKHHRVSAVKASAEPAWEPAVELCDPCRGRSPSSAINVRGTRVLRPQTRRGQDRAKEAIRALKRQTLQRHLPRTWSPTPDESARSTETRWAREDNQERHEIQRDRLNILNTGSSDRSIPDPTATLRPIHPLPPGVQPHAATNTPKASLDTKRHRCRTGRRPETTNFGWIARYHRI